MKWTASSILSWPPTTASSWPSACPTNPDALPCRETAATKIRRTLPMLLRTTILKLGLLLAAAPWASAQLPADAVMLDKVKIPEKQKAIDLCPVYLKPSDPKLPTWQYQGVTYRGSQADAQQKFMQDPARYAKAAEK